MDQHLPQRLPTGHERDAAAARLSQARREGRLALAEFCDRLDAVYTADSAEVLDQVTGNLPAAAPVGISTPPVFSLFGDIVVSGRWRAGDEVRVRTVFGDAKLDFRDAISDDDVLHLRCATTFGDISVQVPERGRGGTHRAVGVRRPAAGTFSGATHPGNPADPSAGLDDLRRCTGSQCECSADRLDLAAGDRSPWSGPTRVSAAAAADDPVR